MEATKIKGLNTAWCNVCGKITMRDKDGGCTICLGKQIKRIDEMQREYLEKERACTCGWTGRAEIRAGFLKCPRCGRVL